MKDFQDTGIIFISPIIGIPPSLKAAFNPLIEKGVSFKGIDIFENQTKAKTLFLVLSLTVLPWSNWYRIQFSNKYDETKLFGLVESAFADLEILGKKRILIGGMSGGFIFASRFIQDPPDTDLKISNSIQKRSIVGLFGISPLIFYPKKVRKYGAQLEKIPHNIPTKLFWGDLDTVIPNGTIKYAQKKSKSLNHIETYVLRGEDYNSKQRGLRHQFFGGDDFVRPLKNIFWNKKAEKFVIEQIEKML